MLKMTSNPPGKCCFVGVKHEGTANGKIEHVGGTSSYVVYPQDESTENAILFLTDAFGHEFINSQLIADQFAANGFFVVMPDLFHGDPAPLNRDAGFDMQGWIAKHQPPQVDPIVHSALKEMRGSLGCKRVGSVGYCFGAKFVVRFLKGGELIDVGYVAHPSRVEPDELKAIQGPLSIAAAEDDFVFPAPKRHESEDILKDIKATYQVNLYSGVSHGFAVRADLSQKKVKFAKEQAFIQALHWFDEHLKV